MGRKSSIDEARDALDNAAGELSDKDAEIEKLNVDISHLRDEIDNLTATIAEQDELMDAQLAKISSLQEQIQQQSINNSYSIV